jgi:lamin B
MRLWTEVGRLSGDIVSFVPFLLEFLCLQEMVLSGWQLVRRAGDLETSFKFHRSVKIEPGATITVWSSDSGQTHEPPYNIVMKGQKWFVGDSMSTTLFNNAGEVSNL